MSSSDDKEGWVVRFVAFTSTVESSFWVRYCQEKLDTIKLSQDPIKITGSYGIEKEQPRLRLQEGSMCTARDEQKNTSVVVHNEAVQMTGVLLGYNTVESFQKVDKNQLLRDWFCPRFFGTDNADSESADQNDDDDDKLQQEALSSFLLLTYADLKNHKVLYWFAMPTLSPSKTSIRATCQMWLWEAWTEQQCQNLTRRVDAMRSVSKSGYCPPFFIATHEQCLPLSIANYHNLMIATKNDEEQQKDNLVVFFGFVDPVVSSDNNNAKEQPMGWPMRNLIAFLSHHLDLGGQTVHIVSYRPKRMRRIYNDASDYTTVATGSADDTSHYEQDNNSLLLAVKIPRKEDYVFENNHEHSQKQYKVVGWELNARSKPGPRWVNLGALLDDKHLAIQAADLNLKLMKWRMIPSLDVNLLQTSTKVLLIGAGTLGCSVARVLLGWGIRDLTFVDYGKVSYSNPVRQSLFSLSDCRDSNSSSNGGGGGRPKAVAAAEALHAIAADVQSKGYVLSIPMPGHKETREAIEASVETMDKLVQDCDVVFLLTDTRESRWLPTVMAAAHDKILINAALGLDSWLVMRHGGGIIPSCTTTTEHQRLGCYFCNDVVAPENSMKNRTLDQQCTVTRPGLSMVASAMAVELLVTLLHHPKRQLAPAPPSAKAYFSPTVEDDDAHHASPLGVMPHQIRGSLVSYTMMTPTVPAFGCCTACSSGVVEAYQKDKMELVCGTCESIDGSYLENLSGLTAFRADAADKLLDVEDWEDDE